MGGIGLIPVELGALIPAELGAGAQTVNLGTGFSLYFVPLNAALLHLNGGCNMAHGSAKPNNSNTRK